ncbi:flippase-like domain-containing protein [Salinibaculum rarum]|uniref:flippase-like domain-containing protein n=1 Tax=Salinibaculum rarum TaxID=3058903 RepID=UPI00265E6F3A|nr:flippase-like domain-containing protein [Salinibaculum sp. KK48]
MSGPVEVSVVLPAYNEEATLRETVTVTLDHLAAFLPADSYEVIVAEDGCEDRTPEIADELAAEFDAVRHIHSEERLGRGGALEYAFREADGETLVYFDTDLATDMRHLEELVESIRTEGYDVATGSRWLPESAADRPAKRGVPSLAYNGFVRLFLRSGVRDHQCGFKAFDREAQLALADDVEDDHWFWDTEILVKAQREGYRVKEFPVDWTPKGDSKVDIIRDVFGMGSQILRTWWELSVSPRITRTTSLAAGTLLVVVALALMTVYLDPQSVLDAITGADPVIVGVSALVYLFSWPLRGSRYQHILERLGHPSDRWFMTGAVFISQTGNLVFPARLGDGVRAYVVKARRGVPYPTGFASLAVERVFDLLAITILASTVLVGLVLTDGTAGIAAAIAADIGTVSIGGETVDPAAAAQTALRVAAAVGAAAVVAVAVIVLNARRETDLIRPAIATLSSDAYADVVAGVLEQFVGDIQTIVSERGAFLRVGGGSLVIWTLDVVTALVVFVAFGIDVTLLLVAVAFFAVSVGNLAKVLPLSPGGIGLYEGAFTLIVVGLTTSPALTATTALAISVVDHAVKNVVTIVGGIVSMAWLNVSLTTAVEQSRDIEAETVE